ncbi:MAG TPA: GNAT family protein [Flavipsychrobacter sp.]|nr:GNAT family protein [Flavipsychrobacter sp.]
MVSIIVDSDIILRTFTPQDAQTLFETIDANRTHLRPWLSWVDGTTKQEHSLAFIEDALSQLQSQQGIALGIFLNGNVIGTIGMHQWNHALKKAQIGYWIVREHEGKGLLSKCLKRFVDFLFDKIDLNKIEIHFVPANKRSAAVADKFNAKIEGVLRDSYLRNGKLEDLVITGILKHEWNQDLQD